MGSPRCELAGAPGEPSKPNVLLIMADQLRRDALGVFGSWAPTPVIDKFAGEATVFDRAITPSPVCQPARVGLATGLFPHNHHLWSNGPQVVAAGAPTWMSALRDAGYNTSVFGKLHLSLHGDDIRLDDDHPRSLGFDIVNETLGPRGCLTKTSHMTAAWEAAGVLDAFRTDLADRLANDPFAVRPSPLPVDLYYDAWVPRQAEQHLRSLPPDQPWLCKVSFSGPHEPWDAPEPYASMLDPAQAPAPMPEEPNDPNLPRSTLDEKNRLAQWCTRERIAEMRANYAGAVALIDNEIGRLLSVVRQRGEWDRTVVVITSDHGEMNGDHGMLYKNTFFESAVAIPLLVRLPDHRGGGRCPAPVSLLDVGPTIAAAAGVALDHEQFGVSLVPCCSDTSFRARRVAVSEFEREYLVFDGRHKLTVNALGESCRLYDIVDDPFEQHNLLGRNAASINTMLRDELLVFLARTQKALGRKAKVPGVKGQQRAAQAYLAAAEEGSR